MSDNVLCDYPPDSWQARRWAKFMAEEDHLDSKKHDDDEMGGVVFARVVFVKKIASKKGPQNI